MEFLSRLKAFDLTLSLSGDSSLHPPDGTNLYDYVDDSKRPVRLPTAEEFEFEPVTVEQRDQDKLASLRNINCEDFTRFALNCTLEAAMMYNSSQKSPPSPTKISDWCKAIRHLTNCAIDWNADCKDVTESHFNDESIRGHMHVVANVCDDDWFLSKYDTIAYCIENAAGAWEECYSLFKMLVDEQKNTTHEWTHYETHFSLCCARTRFRRCTLEALFDKPTACSYEQAVTLQKFSVIISEGDVFQDCERNMMYSNCPGGDPRPSAKALSRLMNAETFSRAFKLGNTFFICTVLCLFFLLLAQ